MALAAVRFLILTAPVFVGAWLVCRHALRLRDPLGSWLAAALLGWLYIVVGFQLLGLVGLIGLRSAALMSVAAGLAGWLVATQRPLGPGARTETEAVQSRTQQASTGTDGQNRTVTAACWLAATLAAWAALDVLFYGLLAPVQPVSDAPIYHLYFAVQWWKSGRLCLVPTPFGESAAPYFPANMDVWFTWLLVCCRSELLAKVGQWPFLVLAAAAVYALGLELTARRAVAFVPAALWATGTLQLISAGVANVDLGMAAWFLAALWFLLRYRRSGRVAELAVSALAAGACLGTKLVATLFIGTWLAVALPVVWSGPRRWRRMALLGAGLLVPCGYWYGRNLLLAGNPFYPLHLSLFGHTVLPGWYTRRTLLTSPYHIPVAHLPVLLQMLLRCLDPVLLPAWLAAALGTGWAAARGRRLPLLLTGLAAAQVSLFWLVNPYQTQERFLLMSLALLAVPVVLVLERWRWLALGVAVLIGWHLTVGQVNLGVASFPGPLPAVMGLVRRGQGGLEVRPLAWARLAMLLGLGSGLAIALLSRGSGRWRPAALAVAMLLALLGCGARLRPDLPARLARSVGLPAPAADLLAPKLRCDRRLTFYPAWPEGGFLPGWLALEQASGRRGARVAYAGTNLPFYLFALGLRNQVRYVNVNRHADFLMHDYQAYYAAGGHGLAGSSTPDWDRRETHKRAWLRNLARFGIELLFIGQTNRAGGLHNVYDADGFPIERTWADQEPGIFELLHADRATRLYRVHLSALSAAPEAAASGAGPDWRR